VSRRIVLSGVILCILWFVQGHGQDLHIKDFRLSEYKVFKVSLSVDLSKWYYADYLSYDIGLNPHYRSISDESEFDWSGYISVDRWSDMTTFVFRTGVDVRHYLSNFFIHGRADMDSWNVYEGFWQKNRYGDLEIGGGIGHLREGYFASAALYINEILKEEDIIRTDLNKITLLKIAQLVANRQGYVIKYDRYEKYLFSELQELIEEDPACEHPVSAYVLFKIHDVVDHHIYSGIPSDVFCWNRQFGTRLSFDLLGSHITDHSRMYGNYAMHRFPLFDSVYYVPGIRAVFDYGNPLSLESHILGYISYQIDWYDMITTHEMKTNITYSRGVIDHFVFTAALDNFYSHWLPSGTTATGFLTINPEVGLTYYIEDKIRFSIDVGYIFDLEMYFVDPFDYEAEHGFMIEVDSRWYIF